MQQGEGLNGLTDDQIRDSLQELCPNIYQVIAKTLFKVLPTLQGEDCPKGTAVNFYFWPGYHSYLANRRIFVRDGSWNFGIGISGDPSTHQQELYSDCSQARWYHYLIWNPRRRTGSYTFSEPMPGHVHQWLRFQNQPSLLTNKPHGKPLRTFINSLTATTAEIDNSEQSMFRGNEVLKLTHSAGITKMWGSQYAKFLNELGLDKKWSFPDRWGKETHDEAPLRNLRCAMHSVWLHAIFCGWKPTWLDGFIRELKENAVTQPAAVSIEQGLADPVATDWGDAGKGRPCSMTWSYVSLHSSLAPSISDLYAGIPQHDETRRRLQASQSLGSAELLCSIPLRPRYLASVRSWISEVYGLIRNAEFSVLLQNHKLQSRRLELSGPFWAHELMKLSDEGLATVLREVDDNRPSATDNRRFVLHSMRMLGTLAYAFTGPLFGGPKGVTAQRDEFMKPVLDLYTRGILVDALREVAQQTYKHVCAGTGARVAFGKAQRNPTGRLRLRNEEQRSCFLLVAEMIRNYCENEVEACVGKWEAAVEDGTLHVRLYGQTHSQRNPVSISLSRLNLFLRALSIGRADVEWQKEQSICIYDVAVNLTQPREARN